MPLALDCFAGLSGGAALAMLAVRFHLAVRGMTAVGSVRHVGRVQLSVRALLGACRAAAASIRGHAGGRASGVPQPVPKPAAALVHALVATYAEGVQSADERALVLGALAELLGAPDLHLSVYPVLAPQGQRQDGTAVPDSAPLAAAMAQLEALVAGMAWSAAHAGARPATAAPYALQVPLRPPPPCPCCPSPLCVAAAPCAHAPHALRPCALAPMRPCAHAPHAPMRPCAHAPMRPCAHAAPMPQPSRQVVRTALEPMFPGHAPMPMRPCLAQSMRLPAHAPPMPCHLPRLTQHTHSCPARLFAPPWSPCSRSKASCWPACHATCRRPRSWARGRGSTRPWPGCATRPRIRSQSRSGRRWRPARMRLWASCSPLCGPRRSPMPPRAARSCSAWCRRSRRFTASRRTPRPWAFPLNQPPSCSCVARPQAVS
jgi:hypothetical protein